MKGYRFLKAMKILLFVLLASVVFGFIVQGLWNWLMPALFGLHVITFWQALGLFLLSKILANTPFIRFPKEAAGEHQRS